MGLEEFSIVFDKADIIYAPGETVCGKLVLVLSSPKKLTEIRIKAKGQANVQWTERRTERDSDGRSRTRTVHYNNSEVYFNFCSVVESPTDGSNSMTIEAGTYSYPFSFDIPSNIPCSFEHHIGHVRYTIKAVIDRPWRFDHRVISGFTVIVKYDLNNYPDLFNGIYDKINRQFRYCLCFGNAGNLVAVANSRVKGFVPGETIELDVSYHNTSSSVDIEDIKLSLRKEMKFHARTKTKYVTDVIKDVIVGGPCLKEREEKLCIEVPPTVPSFLMNCNIIDVSYYLVLKLQTSGMHCTIKHTYPIQIGTIPLYHQVTNQAQIDNVPSAPPMHQATNDTESLLPIGFVMDSAPPYSELPPPSYEECIGGSKLIGDPNKEGCTPFAPKYPVYKFPVLKP